MSQRKLTPKPRGCKLLRVYARLKKAARKAQKEARAK